MYIDGQLVGSTAIMINPVQIDGNIVIGTRLDDVTNSDAKYDNVRVWGVARSQAEVQQDMISCFTGNEAGLEILYDMEEGIGTVLNDLATANGAQDATIVGSASWTTGNVVGNVISDQTITPLSATVCDGGSVTVDLGSSEVGVNYFLRDDSNDAFIAGPVAGNGSSVSITSPVLNQNSTLNVFATTSSNTIAGLQFDRVDDKVDCGTGTLWKVRTIRAIGKKGSNSNIPI